MRFAVQSGRLQVAVIAGLVLLVLACGRQSTETASEIEPSGSTSPVVARVEGEPIHVEDVLARAPRRPGQRDPAQRVEEAIGRRLVAREARRRHLDEAPGVRERIAAIRRKAVEREEDALRDALFGSLRDEIELTEAELQQHYEETRARYFERQIRLRRRVFDSPEAAQAADAALGPTGRLDPETSEDLGPASPRDLPRSLLPEALQLRVPGERVVVGEGEEWALVELVEILAAVPRPLEQVRDRVETSLRTQRAQQAFGQLMERVRAEADVEIDREVLEEGSLWGVLEDRSGLAGKTARSQQATLESKAQDR